MPAPLQRVQWGKGYEHGPFDYPYLDDYWTEPGRYPFLVRVEGKLVGFVLVSALEETGNETIWEMAEFFILRKYRRHEIGRMVAHQVFDLFAGKWRVTQEEGNLPAQAFWRRVIELNLDCSSQASLTIVHDLAK